MDREESLALAVDARMRMNESIGALKNLTDFGIGEMVRLTEERFFNNALPAWEAIIGRLASEPSSPGLPRLMEDNRRAIAALKDLQKKIADDPKEQWKLRPADPSLKRMPDREAEHAYECVTLRCIDETSSPAEVALFNARENIDALIYFLREHPPRGRAASRILSELSALGHELENMSIMRTMHAYHTAPNVRTAAFMHYMEVVAPAWATESVGLRVLKLAQQPSGPGRILKLRSDPTPTTER